jgi:hypothetical protein
MQRRLPLSALVLMVFSGCEAIPTLEDAKRHADASGVSNATGEEAERHAPASADSNPFAVHALPPERQGWLDGWVEDRLAAGSYVYLRVRTTAPDGVTWVASLAMTTPNRRHVRILVLGRAGRFHSRRLRRDFQPLLFGVVRAASSDVAPLSKGT